MASKEAKARIKINKFLEEAGWKNEAEREQFIEANRLRLTHEHQQKAIQAVLGALLEGQSRSLQHMGTGTGKTVTAVGIIQLILRTRNAQRVSFLADRLELEKLGNKASSRTLANDDQVAIYEENLDNWRYFQVVVTIVQSLLINNRYTHHCQSGAALSPAERTHLLSHMQGYDISPDMVRLSLVNMYLHGFTDPHIMEYDTLTSDERWQEHADIILANPPFMSPKGGIRPHKRFSVQSNRSEVLFVDYIAEHLTPTGRAAIVVPEGVIFQSGNAYKSLRKMLIEEN